MPRYINTPQGMMDADEADRRSGPPTGMMPAQAAPSTGTAYTGPTSLGFVGANPDINAGNMTAEEAMYRQGAQGLQSLAQGATAQFAPGAAAQAEATRVLGMRAANLQDSAAAQAAMAGRERAQAAAAAAPAAILGGQVGAAGAQGELDLAREAQQRRAAYLQSIQQQGAAGMAEAEQRRLLEAAQLRDLQTRYAAAQGLAAAQRQQQKANEQRGIGTLASLAGAGLGFALGGPAGVAAGMQLGEKLGGG